MKTCAYFLLVMLLAACSVPQAETPTVPALVPADTPQANMPNPAAVFCEEQGYTIELRTAADGSQSAACIFPDGSECDEWAYFRNECSPGQFYPSSNPNGESTPTLSAKRITVKASSPAATPGE